VVTKQTSERGVCNHLWALVSQHENLIPPKGTFFRVGAGFLDDFLRFPIS
jgi:hypothetical protein